jgi:hypothetical protein
MYTQFDKKIEILLPNTGRRHEVLMAGLRGRRLKCQISGYVLPEGAVVNLVEFLQLPVIHPTG